MIKPRQQKRLLKNFCFSVIEIIHQVKPFLLWKVPVGFSRKSCLRFHVPKVLDPEVLFKIWRKKSINLLPKRILIIIIYFFEIPIYFRYNYPYPFFTASQTSYDPRDSSDNHNIRWEDQESKKNLKILLFL